MDTRARIARNLKLLRIAQRITQENLSVDAAVDRTVISDLERGKHNASVDLLDRLASALGADISAFFNIPHSNEPAPPSLKSGRKAKSP
ncbi:XRE family transcriptional regulator [Nostoc linckia z8]|uniref:XRE family transcriptional regulator n=1 Tax=Nostoc linckia z8 TaxID=1628746 RepID=A0A9Q5Z3X3_NOSLI|nr:XRE family transcriptional regulator [Nostoc linckia z8]